MKRLHHMLRAAAGAYSPPVATDPQFKYVSLLLNDTGTNGQQNNTFRDSSTNNFTITRNGTPTQGSVTPYWPDGQWSNYFNGSTDYIGVPSNAALNPSNGAFTFETWFYPLSFTQTSTAGDTIFIVETSGGVQIGKRESAGGNVWGLCSNGIAWRLTTSTQPTNNAWNHIVIVRSGTGANQTSIFLNGVRVANGTVTDTFAQGLAYIGGGTSAGAKKINGYLSSTRFVKGTAVYDPTQTTLTVPTAPLTAISGTSLLTCQSNRFKDNSSNNFAITVTGTPQVTAFDPFSPSASYSTGTYGGSGYFNGTTDYVSAPGGTAFVFGSGNFTIEAWVYQNATPNGSAIICEQYPSPNEVNFAIGFCTSPGSVGGALPFCGFFASGVGWFGATASAAQPNNTWYHVAYVRNGSTHTLYINGVASGSFTYSGSMPSGTDSILVGRRWDTSGSASYFNGYISNVRVVKGTAVYTANFTPPTAPVTAITNTSLLLNFTNAGIYDAATLNNLVTVGDAKVSTAQAKWGSSSMAFDGTGDWLTFPDSSTAQLGSGDFTIEGWVYLSTTGTAKYIAAKGTSTTGWAFGINSSNQLVFNYTSSTLTGATALSSGQWYYVAVVRSGTATGNVKIYLSGAADATSSGAITDNFNQTNAGYIGADRTGANPMNGYIDDLRITKGYARTISTPTAAFPTR